MCYQLLQIFECGHNNGSKIVKCEKPTSKCGGIFLRQELEETKGLCEVFDRDFLSLKHLLTSYSHVNELRMHVNPNQRNWRLRIRGIGLDA